MATRQAVESSSVTTWWLGEVMVVRVEDQIETTRDAKLPVDRADMVADRVIADEEALGDFVVLESVTHQVQHFALPMAERRNLRLLGIRVLGQFRRSHVPEHTTDDRAIVRPWSFVRNWVRTSADVYECNSKRPFGLSLRTKPIQP